jgi:quercetin dioxygenase-like cupin family protein
VCRWGELWYLHELATWLRQHERSRFLLTAPPLRLPGTVGSPVTRIATDGWNINTDGAGDWIDWGDGDRARAKVLATGDGYLVVLVEAEAGYVGTPHDHTNTEFAYVLTGTLRNQHQVMGPGGAYVAERGTRHTDFETLGPASYLSIFKL